MNDLTKKNINKLTLKNLRLLQKTMAKVIFNTQITNINEDVLNLFSTNKISALYNKLNKTTKFIIIIKIQFTI